MHFNFLNNFTSNSSNVDTSKFGGESETISYLRFPLIVLVVMIHSKFDGVVVNGVGLMHDGGFLAILQYLPSFQTLLRV